MLRQVDFVISYGRFERSCSCLNILELLDPEDRDTTIPPRDKSYLALDFNLQF